MSLSVGFTKNPLQLDKTMRNQKTKINDQRSLETRAVRKKGPSCSRDMDARNPLVQRIGSLPRFVLRGGLAYSLLLVPFFARRSLGIVMTGFCILSVREWCR